MFLSGCSQKSATVQEGLNANVFKHEISSELVKIRVTDKTLLADQKKIEIMNNYEVLPRLLEEIDSQLQAFPDTTAEIELYGFRLRSGSTGIFSFAGPDFLSGDVTVKKKNKQVAFFSADIRSSNSGKHHPPTRRIVALIKSFGEDVSREINLANGTPLYQILTSVTLYFEHLQVLLYQFQFQDQDFGGKKRQTMRRS